MVKSNSRRCSWVLAVLSITGCTTLGPDFQTPSAPIAENWTQIENPKVLDEADAHAEWWKVFNDPRLDQLIETAYQDNLSLQIVGVRILEARARLGIAVGNLYPQLQQANGGAIYTDLSKNSANTAAADLSYLTYDLGIDVGWELDLWGKFGRGIDSANASLLASVARYDDFLVSLTAQVANAYVLIRTFEERIRLARHNVTIQRRSLQIASVRFRNGLTSELDKQQAKTLLRSTQASIPELQLGLSQTRHALAVLLGLPPGEVEALLGEPGSIPSPPLEVAAGMPADLLRRRPDVRQAELQAASQAALIGIAEAELYPSFSLLGNIGLVSADKTNTTRTGESGLDELIDADSIQFIGGPSFSWNIFNYGRLKNNVRVQDARYQQLIAAYQNTVLRAAQEVEDALVGFVKTQEQEAFLSDSVAAANRSVQLALVQYRDGVTDYTTVLNTQQSLVQQQDALTGVRGDISNNLIAVYKALSGGWQLRTGRDFIPDEIRKTMHERSDWGELLEPDAISEEKKRQISW